MESWDWAAEVVVMELTRKAMRAQRSTGRMVLLAEAAAELIQVPGVLVALARKDMLEALEHQPPQVAEAEVLGALAGMRLVTSVAMVESAWLTPLLAPHFPMAVAVAVVLTTALQQVQVVLVVAGLVL
jgi:hypothetical protein